jgi:hypothetical protein
MTAAWQTQNHSLFREAVRRTNVALPDSATAKIALGYVYIHEQVREGGCLRMSECYGSCVCVCTCAGVAQNFAEIEPLYANAVLAAMQQVRAFALRSSRCAHITRTSQWKAVPVVSLRAKVPLLAMFRAIVEMKDAVRVARDTSGCVRVCT